MASSGSFTARRLHALQAAQRTLDDLGFDLTERIDVFDAIERLGLFVTFLPLDNLLGATIPKGDGGVLITTKRPAGVQRFTAAHEIGHWILDQDYLALDGELEVHGTPPAERERLAQVFAGYFTMPPPLIHGTAARHGIRQGEVPRPQTFTSLLGTSERATRPSSANFTTSTTTRGLASGRCWMSDRSSRSGTRPTGYVHTTAVRTCGRWTRSRAKRMSTSRSATRSSWRFRRTARPAIGG